MPRSDHPQPTEPLPGIRCVRAPNPSPMTAEGTNSFILGRRKVLIVDPGPADPAHLAALEAALPAGARVQGVFVTHTHLDHSAGAPLLAARLGAPLLGFGDWQSGRSPEMEALLAGGAELAGGEGIDRDFLPDERLRDGDEIDLDIGPAMVLHTPGHVGNHLCLALPAAGVVLTGDHVMGWATTMISPPEGDMSAYLASLERLSRRGDDRLHLPAHGGAITDPAARLAELIAHRRRREREIRSALAALGRARVDELARHVYRNLPPALRPAAERNVLAHLLDLTARGLTAMEGPAGPQALFRIAG